MPSSLGTTSATSLQPALELIYLAKLQPELASQSLRKLLLANPNYFENLPESSFKVVLNMNGDTAFESLGCVSYIALLDQLYASVQLKRDWGYSFGLDNSSSRQYVRIYLSFDRGVTWQNGGPDRRQCLRRTRSQTAYPSRDKADRTSRTTQVRFTRTPGSRRNSLLEFASSSGTPPDWIPFWGNVLETAIHTIRPDGRRTDCLQAGSWARFADASGAEGRVGRTSDLSDSGRLAPPRQLASLPQTKFLRRNTRRLRGNRSCAVPRHLRFDCTTLLCLGSL